MVKCYTLPVLAGRQKLVAYDSMAGMVKWLTRRIVAPLR